MIREQLHESVDRVADRCARLLRTTIMRAVHRGQPVQSALATIALTVQQQQLSLLIAGHVVGRDSAQRSLKRRTGMSFSLADDVAELLSKPEELTPEQLEQLRDQYIEEARNAASSVLGSVEAKLQTELEETEGTIKASTIREKLDLIGIGPDKPFLLRTALRTQIHLGTAAGRIEVLDLPEIQDVLWGYEYVAITDNRIRPSHAALDGIRLPKEDARWKTIWPPNGYNCRCEVIELWVEEEPTVADVPESVEVDGEAVTPGPDKGWDFSPRDLRKVA